MPLKPPRACKTPTCNGHAVAHDLCEKCLAERPAHVITKANFRENMPLYNSKEWKSFRPLLIARNPICQRINADIRCTNPSKIVHHLQDPRVRPDLKLSACNAVAVCANCHPGGQAGDNDQNTYVPTRWIINFEEVFYEHPVAKRAQEAYLKAGCIVDPTEALLRAEQEAKLAKQRTGSPRNAVIRRR
jgi:hypothetical protein